MKKNLTCIECPIGCSIEVEMVDGAIVSVSGHSCPRGKLYAENEVVCPKRVVTSTVRATNGKMVPVKTDVPVRKTAIFDVMKKINDLKVDLPVKIGDILMKNIVDEANLVAAGNVE